MQTTKRPSSDQSRSFFLGWQCRIRQIAMRQHGGRPLPGMCPRVLTASGDVVSEALTVLLVQDEPAESTDFFRFQVLKTIEAEEAYRKTLDYLSADYFQDPSRFSDRMTALFGADTLAARTLSDARRCILEMDQYRQAFRLPCTVRILKTDDPAYQATLWHNRAFNPRIPDGVTILSFTPDWKEATADPPPP